MRRIGETQVLRLDTHTLRIDRVIAGGENPGWISHHTAALATTMILVAGGTVDTPQGGAPNTDVFALVLATMTWSRRAEL